MGGTIDASGIFTPPEGARVRVHIKLDSSTGQSFNPPPFTIVVNSSTGSLSPQEAYTYTDTGLEIDSLFTPLNNANPLDAWALPGNSQLFFTIQDDFGTMPPLTGTLTYYFLPPQP